MKLDKIYEPGKSESDIYAMWEQSGAFIAQPDSEKEHFSIAMPPPNETGTLSLGHALFLTLQDIMARHQRQLGKDVLWLPGTDHAALAVNTIIEKKLAGEGTDKHEIGREAFMQKTRDFVGTSRETMLNQMRAMGASADWSRLRYTLDETLNRCVNETFVKMYEDGLIYRGARIVNWDPNLQTSISDDEVEYVDEVTTFYTFKYGPFEMGTTRPETKFGTQYVVMHPDDERYLEYKHGDTFETDWINGTVKVTIIKDPVMDMGLGTGVMSITPWHSHVDFEIAERHGLEKEQIIDEQGILLPLAGEFAGMHITEARAKIVEKLRSKGLVSTEKSDYEHNVATNERGKGIIEPQIRLQWWVDVNRPVVEWKGTKRSLKEILQSVVNDGDINIIPARFNKTYFHWIDNLRDWCISRQIWWGHQVPAWYKDDETFVGVLPPDDETSWTRDPDTLDTWFSSALWTWSTLIDQDLANNYDIKLEDLLAQSKDFQAYHPTNVMETGWDILFFWVARMILSTSYVTGQIPFKDVYLHGMVRAEDGKKMSKSRPESIIDPLEVIPKYGTDALRMALIMGVSPGNDQNWSTSKIEANRNFCNKIWNIARFIESTLAEELELGESPVPKTIADEWVIAKVSVAGETIRQHLAEYRFSEAYTHLYHMIWDDVADWYIEASKGAPNASVLNWALESILKLTHPFAPFVTETIWQTLYENADQALISAPWPMAERYNESSLNAFEDIIQIVTEVRHIKTMLKISGGELLFIDSQLVSQNSNLILKLARLEKITSTKKMSGIQLTQTSHDCWLNIDKETAKTFMSSLSKQLTDADVKLKQLNGRLSNKSYIEKAPKHLVEATQDQIEQLESERETIQSQLKLFENV